MIEPVTTNLEWLGLVDEARAGWFNDAAGELAPEFPLGADDVLVDVGAGSGGLAQYCARRVAQVLLVEPDADALAATVARLKTEGTENIAGLPGDAASVPLPDAFASRVLCCEVLEHVDDPARVLADLVRIGRPGARYLLTVPGEASEGLQAAIGHPSYFEKPNHVRIFTEDAFTRLVESAGLEIVNLQRRGFFWSLWWTLFWAPEPEPPAFGNGRVPLDLAAHPLLEAWTRTWGLLLATPGGDRIKAALDALAPKSIAIVARKPG